jgi:hypothetical protein
MSTLPCGDSQNPGVDWDQRTNAKDIYRITGEGHKGWSKHVDKELGNYDYLLGADVRPISPCFINSKRLKT